VNAPIRLLAALVLVTSVCGCAEGTRAGATSPRLVREPMFLRNEGAAPITASPVLLEARPAEHGRAIFSLGPGIAR
jgi:hypothetical protein